MPIWVTSSTIWVGWECSRCGNTGNEEVDAMQMQGCALEVHEMECPKCGNTMWADGDEYDSEDEE